MPLYVDQIVQQATGDFEGSSGTVSLPGGTSAGSLVLICVALASDTAVSDTNLKTNVPTGGAGTFVRLGNAGPGGNTRAGVDIYAQRNVAAGETSWTLTAVTGTPQVTWCVIELTGVGLDPYDTWEVAGGFVPNATTLVSSAANPNAAPTSGTTTCLETLGVSVFAATSADTTPPVISTYTLAHVVTGATSESSQVAQAGRSNATTAMSLGVAFTQILETDGFKPTASVSPDSYLTSGHVVLYADHAKFLPDFARIFGAEIGTATNLSVGSSAVTGSAPFQVVVGSPEIVSTFARSGSYSLKLSSIAAAESAAITLADIGFSGNRHWVERFCVYFDTSLPLVDVELYSLEAGSLANGMVVTFRAASNKIGVKIGSGTEVLSDAAVAANKWIGIDLRYDTRTTAHTCDWQVDYDSLDTTVAPVAQTQVSTTAMTAADITTVRTGWTAVTLTATVYYDDLVSSAQFGVYPIGDQRVVPLKVDPTGTPYLFGSSSAANFKTFVGGPGGTLSAWTAVDTRNRLATIPPVVGSSATGLLQVAVAANDAIVIPMETFQCAPLYTPRAGRVYLAGCAASTTAATMAAQMIDSSNAGAVIAGDEVPRDHNWDATTLRWLTYRLSYTDGTYYAFNQATVDSFEVTVGFSNDAAPDVGICGLLIELCVSPTQAQVVVEAEDAAFKVYARRDPVTFATRGAVVTTPSGTRGGTLYTTINGVDYTDYVPAGQIWEHPGIEATSIADVTNVGFSPDPTV